MADPFRESQLNVELATELALPTLNPDRLGCDRLTKPRMSSNVIHR